MSETLIKDVPLCPVFGTCGGCQHQNISYEEELRLKEASLREALGRQVDDHAFAVSPVVASPRTYHYRNRLDLKLVKTRRGTLHVGFTPVEKGVVVEVDACPIAMEQISAFLPRLREEALARIPKKYHMANLTVRCGDGSEVRWGGIGKRSLRLEEKDYFSTKLCGLEIFYSLDTFFQANLSILPVLARELRALPIWSNDISFFDLYGGVGLMGLLVHDLVGRVFNIEENVHSVRLARHNLTKNTLKNVEVFEGRVELILPELLQKTASSENVVMVDPPRAGLSKDAVALLNKLPRVRHLLYLSCDPGSLAQNLADLTAGPWQIMKIQPFDFFPRTKHLETLVLLKNKTQG
jgi:tRNA/tmRNA/rRNA uracil-C5-methylase (TrmA/RlmC/RlmD family)